ncbi:carbohydrate-binding protein [Tengunoibacter tsumagoiensis]|uniref:carbohydrate-binding protein n=1 Tax=Tengunoibacter tsumagoiensis TaxID=2014871 RepID=UPI003530D006
MTPTDNGADVMSLGNLDEGSWAKYSCVDLSQGVSAIDADYATGSNFGGTLDIHMDKLDGPLLGTIQTSSTSAPDIYTTLDTNLSSATVATTGGTSIPATSVTGIHDFYVVAHLTTVSSYVANLLSLKVQPNKSFKGSVLLFYCMASTIRVMVPAVRPPVQMNMYLI